MLLSIVIPAYNEEENIRPTVTHLHEVLAEADVAHEIVVVNDNSTDGTEKVLKDMQRTIPNLKYVNNSPPGGFGRAIRRGLMEFTGDAVVIYMADQSDHPEDAVLYYKKLQEGYDCVYGSRFIKGSDVQNYPWLKLIVNRIVNRCIQLFFRSRFNDLTNAFKAYRSYVIHDCGPYRASHFNITIEMSLSALIRKYNIAQVPIKWSGRNWGQSNLRVTTMGRRYLSTLLKIIAEKTLVSDDIVAEKLAHNRHVNIPEANLIARLKTLEGRVQDLEEKRILPSIVATNLKHEIEKKEDGEQNSSSDEK